MSVVLSEHLPLVATAHDGISKLRGLILQLAVMGKLVPQDSNEEPASELLKRNAKERARRIEQSTRRKAISASDITESTMPFLLPVGWEWSNIAELAEVIRGVSYEKSQASEIFRDGYVALIRGNNINATLNLDRLVYVPTTQVSAEQLIRRGDVVIAMSSGSAHLVGKAAQAELDLGYGFGAFCGLIRAYLTELHPYFGFFFQTPMYRNCVAGHGKGIGINNLQKGSLLAIACPVPPLAEQHRIVAKVDELMALCDRLEAEQSDAESAHFQLVEALLGTLTQSSGAADLASNWQRIAEQFDLLFTTEGSVDTLKKAILQMAVTGRLVPHDPSEPPVSGKLGDFVEFLNGYAFKSEWFCSTGIRLLRNVNVSHGAVDWKDAAYIPAERSEEFVRFSLKPGDLVLSLDRPIINTGLKIARITESDLPCLLLQRVAKIIPLHGALTCDYLFIWFNSRQFVDSIDPGRSNGVPHISTKQTGELSFDRPSLAEQHRIVARVDELMALCDRMKADLRETRGKLSRLAETLIDVALEIA